MKCEKWIIPLHYCFYSDDLWSLRDSDDSVATPAVGGVRLGAESACQDLDFDDQAFLRLAMEGLSLREENYVEKMGMLLDAEEMRISSDLKM